MRNVLAFNRIDGRESTNDLTECEEKNNLGLYVVSVLFITFELMSAVNKHEHQCYMQIINNEVVGCVCFIRTPFYL